MQNELLGFDIRLCANDYVDARWSRSGRDLYLLQPTTAWPLSVDQMVWPSLFRYSKDRGPGYLDIEGVIDVTPRSTRDSALELWSSLDEMKAYVMQQPADPRRGLEIAVTLLADEAALSREYWRAVLDPPLSPNEPPTGWELLGYDVADEYMLSGLTNCGYSEHEKPSLEKTWANRLNEFGLLTTLEDATEFKKVSDHRVAEHKPFFVYGLFCATIPRT